MKRLISVLCALLIPPLSGMAAAEPVGQFQNTAVFIDGAFYDGAPFFWAEEGTRYVPLADVSARAGLDEPVLEDGFIDWQGFWMDAESEDFFFRGDKLYATEALLLDAGLVIRMGQYGDQPVIWIEDPEKTLLGDWSDDTMLIAHAMGSIDQESYTNSLEAFIENYAKGFRVFEVDFSLTSDGLPAATHDWAKFAGFIGEDPETYSPPTLAEFKEKRILGSYTPVGFDDIVRLMVKYPDIRIITDTKGGEMDVTRRTFEALLSIASGIDASVLDRIVPQIYNNEMLDVILDIYPWKSVIYTMYALPEGMSRAEAFRYGYKRGIRVFTTGMNTTEPLFLELIRLTGCRLYRHTINDWEYYRTNKARGELWGIYTDNLSPLSMDGVEEWMDE